MLPPDERQIRPGEIQQVFELVGDVYALAGDTASQRRRVRQGLGDLLGRATGFALMYGRPRTRRLIWFIDWIQDTSPEAAPGRPAPPISRRQRRLLRLFISELYRLHRAGRLDGERGARPSGLSPRQQQVLEGLLSGRGLKQIAWQLDMSRRTADDHAQALYRRFNVRSRAELMARFIACGAASRDGVRFRHP